MTANLQPLQSLTSFNPFSMGIDLVGDLLGLSPEVKNVAKVALGVVTGNPILAIDGGLGLFQNAQQVAQTEWSPPRTDAAGDGYAPAESGTVYYGSPPVIAGGGATVPPPPTRSAGTSGAREPVGVGTGTITQPPPNAGSRPSLSQDDRAYYAAVDALWRDFDKFETAGSLKLRDGILTREDLAAVARDPKVPDHVRRAAGYFIDHPSRLDSLMRSPAVGTARVDRDRLAAEVREGERRGAYSDGFSNVTWIPGPVVPGGTPAGGSKEVQDIMANSSLSPMEKVEMLMQEMADAADQEALGIAQDIDRMQAQQRSLDAKSPEGQKKAAELQESIDKKMQRMQKLVQRRTEMMALITNLNQMQHENAMRCIERMAR